MPARARSSTAFLGVALLLIGTLVAWAYRHTLQVPFVLDDGPAVVGNPTLRPGSGWAVLLPPPGTSVASRPVANLTFAFNYAVSQESPGSYHVLNLVILILGGLALYGLAWRTLAGPRMAERFGADAQPLGLLVALLWTVHPLLTEAVTYTVQRVESLMGLWLLLTLYCFARSRDGRRPAAWQAAAIAACALGMATKEVMAAAPLLVLLYDRAFAAGSFPAAWRAHRGFYLALAATWLPLALLVGSSGADRNGTAGLVGHVGLLAYWATQLWALPHYLQLAIWPHPLVFDYGTLVLTGGSGVAVGAGVVVVLVAATAAGLARNAPWGFLGAWFFSLLAPTSLVPVVTQTVAEHRMYLPLAAVVALVVVGAYALWGRRCVIPFALAVLCLCVTTARRNQVYRTDLALWSDTVAQAPANARAQCSLGLSLAANPQTRPQAIAHYEEALRLQPGYAVAHNDLAIALEDTPGGMPAALAHLETAVQLNPAYATAFDNLGFAQTRLGQTEPAAASYRMALRLDPGDAETHAHLGALLYQTGDATGGEGQFETALRLQPGDAQVQFYFANALVASRNVAQAIPHYRAALLLRPHFVEAESNLGATLFRAGERTEGMQFLDAAVQERPDFVPAHFARAAALFQSGERTQAVAELDQILRLDPENANALRLRHAVEESD